MADTFHYSLIRAVPDRRRGEWVNIGVVVFRPDSLDVRVIENLSKLRMLCPELDSAAIKQIPQFWRTACAGLSGIDERHGLLLNTPMVHPSPTSQFLATEESYEDAVMGILRDLVEPPPQPRQRSGESRVQTKLKEMFRKAKILGEDHKDIHRHRVVPHFPIDASSGMLADFALKNGQMHITQVIDFRVKPEQLKAAKRGEVGLKAMGLVTASKVYKGGLVPMVVYSANASTIDLAQPSLNLLHQHAEHVFDLDNTNDAAAYMQRMKLAAGDSLH